MEINFKDDRALVTGAGKGIGRAIAKALWEGGANVTALSRTQGDLDSLKAECPGINIVTVDLQNWENTRVAVESVGPIDLLVNNAGNLVVTTVLDTPEDNFDQMMNIHVKANVNVTQIVARGMVERKKGAIVNMSSVVSRMHTTPMFYVYSTAKAALDQLTRCQAVELGPHGIRVNSVNPTVVATWRFDNIRDSMPDPVQDLLNRTARKELAEEKDVVNLTLYLLSDKAAMINGAIVPVDGGSWCS